MTLPTSRCASCGAPVLWYVTVNGKRMPLDARSDPDGLVVIEDGVAHVLTKAQREQPELIERTRYTSHHATCPNADRHRPSRHPAPPPGVVDLAAERRTRRPHRHRRPPADNL